ncbi:hypothetical protein [Nonomuraea candida]|uniref:hypothetical protein n=1 Tax=Nonomuraea candida TaxID=359159 RepID=UPI000A8BCB39|nr:hypothetical protein [Nonomuraea candida]
MTTTKARPAPAESPARARWRCLARPCDLRARWQTAADRPAAEAARWRHYLLMHWERP